MDWHQLWEITSAPDNVPIVALIGLVPFYTWYGIRQALANDRLIAQLGSRPATRQDASPQDAALEARLDQGSSGLALSPAH